MSKTIASAEKVGKLFRLVAGALEEITATADKNQTYFWADCRVQYRQVFEVDLDSDIGGEIGVDDAVLGGMVEVPVSAGASAGLGIDKNKQGEIIVDETIKVRSKAALEQG